MSSLALSEFTTHAPLYVVNSPLTDLAGEYLLKNILSMTRPEESLETTPETATSPTLAETIELTGAISLSTTKAQTTEIMN